MRALNNLVAKKECVLRSAKDLLRKKEAGIDQIVIILILIAVAAGLIGLFYTFTKGTLIPNLQGKLTNSINNWFSGN